MQVETTNTYETALIDVLQGMTLTSTTTTKTKFQYIFSGRNSAEPKSPFAYITQLSETPQGRGTKLTHVVEKDGKFYEVVSRDFSVDFAITFHGLAKSDAEDACNYLTLGFESTKFQNLMHKNGIGLLDYTSTPRLIEAVNGVTNFINDTVNITILTTRVNYYEVDYFDSVKVTGDVLVDNPQPNVTVEV